MWCELVMLPPVYNPSAATNAGVGANGAPTGPTTPNAVNAAAAVAAAYPTAGYPSVPAVTGLPINKDLKLSLPVGLITSSSTPTSSQKIDTTNHFHIFVGDLAPEIETQHLREVFSAFGIVTECKIIKDMHTQKPKGYGFVAYATREEAEEAIQRMNGQLLGSRTIRTNWAVRKPPQAQAKDQKPLNYMEVCNASSASNCTVYVGGITKGLCEDIIRDAFREYGEILEVRIFKEKGYAFIRFDTHEGATKAIITMHGREVLGQPCKCSWGKESSEGKENAVQALFASPYNYFAGQQLSYSYNPLNYLQPQLSYTGSFQPTGTGLGYPPARTVANGLLNGYVNSLAQQAVALNAAAAVAANANPMSVNNAHLLSAALATNGLTAHQVAAPLSAVPGL